jgi:hypothetical protein
MLIFSGVAELSSSQRQRGMNRTVPSIPNHDVRSSPSSESVRRGTRGFGLAFQHWILLDRCRSRIAARSGGVLRTEPLLAYRDDAGVGTAIVLLRRTAIGCTVLHGRTTAGPHPTEDRRFARGATTFAHGA